MKKLIKNLIEKEEQRIKYLKKIYELDNDINQLIVRIKKEETNKNTKKEKLNTKKDGKDRLCKAVS